MRRGSLEQASNHTLLVRLLKIVFMMLIMLMLLLVAVAVGGRTTLMVSTVMVNCLICVNGLTLQFGLWL